MSSETDCAGIFALDVRPRICGYAAFDGGRLLDWGCLRTNPQTAFIRALGRVGRVVHPDILLLRRLSGTSPRSRPTTRAVSRTASSFARSQGWTVEYISEAALQRFFRQSGYKTNEQIALALANTFPELKPKLPSHRRLWDPQDWRMPIFDAAGLVVAFMAERSNKDSAGSV